VVQRQPAEAAEPRPEDAQLVHGLPRVAKSNGFDWSVRSGGPRRINKTMRRYPDN
jgi:hypothetical protein